MQDEINKEIIVLFFRYPGKFTVNLLIKAWEIAVEDKTQISQPSYKQLGENNSMGIDITNKEVGKAFAPYAQKYNLGYAIKVDKSQTPSAYQIWFKVKDQNVLRKCIDELKEDILEGKWKGTEKFKEVVKETR